MVLARTTEGEIAFLTGHAPFIGALGVGKVRIQLEGGGNEMAAVHGGFIEVRDNQVTILSDVAELASQIDVARAEAAKQSAEERLRSEDDAEAQGALARAMLR